MSAGMTQPEVDVKYEAKTVAYPKAILAPGDM